MPKFRSIIGDANTALQLVRSVLSGDTGFQQIFASGSVYYLLYEGGYTGSSLRHRIYIDADQSFKYTCNASWSDGTSLWTADNIAAPAFRFDLGFLAFACSVKSSTTTPWVDDDWNPQDASPSSVLRAARFVYDSTAGIDALCLQLVGQLTTSSSAPLKNALYADSMVKAWGHIVITGGGGVGNWLVDYVNSRYFNVGTVTRTNAQRALVTYSTPMATGEAATIPSSYVGSTAYLPLAITGSANVTLGAFVSNTGVAVDMDALSGTIIFDFVTLGRQNS